MNSMQITVNMDFRTSRSGELEVVLEVRNTLGKDLPDWDLYFDFPKTIAAGQDTRFLGRIGSHIHLAADDSSCLHPGQQATLCFTGLATIIQRLSDLPNGLYLQSQGQYYEAVVSAHNFPTAPSDSRVGETYGSAPAPEGEGRRSTHASDSVHDEAIAIIPKPRGYRHLPGHYQLPDTLGYHGPAEAADAIAWLARSVHGTAAQSADKADLQFALDGTLPAEAYQLEINTGGIQIIAGSPEGMFYGVSSLLQLIHASEAQSLRCLRIEDVPRFGYRGFMLDCARHFQEKSAIFRVLDYMALYKLNRFHWHLTDDEGWRLEIKAFPQLTQTGAWRGAEEALSPQFGSGAARYGGFYTQQEVREVLAYASARQIVVIPEIDIPGHARAAIKSLPELLVEPEDQSQYCSVQFYDDNVINPGLPGTYEFLYGVLDEVCALFPGPYVHIGGDEVPEGVWQQSPACRALMDEHGYQGTLDLQGHLFRNVQTYLNDKGKQLIGWEEAAHGEKLESSAVVCAWSSVEATARAGEAGYQVISCPAPLAYLDMAWDNNIHEPGFHWAGTATLEACYHYDPMGNDACGEQYSHVIGTQTLLWSELITSQERLEYMIFPRVLAGAETAWSAASAKDWPCFQRRVEGQLDWLATAGVAHRPYRAG
jgi:hexosaminidase